MTDGFDLDLAWEAVRKDAEVPPENDPTTQYADREENVGYEARAGLTLYREKGWVGNEEVRRDRALPLPHLLTPNVTSSHGSTPRPPRARSHTRTTTTPSRGLLRRRGTWPTQPSISPGLSRTEPFSTTQPASWRPASQTAAGLVATKAGPKETSGVTPSTSCTTSRVRPHYASPFKALGHLAHFLDASLLSGLVELKGGREPFLAFLDDHFDGNHNDHTNEPSHHIPYLYSLAGSPSRAAERVHAIAFEDGDYGLGPEGLRGNEDLGQMSSWFIFSSLGFYPVNPASDEYVIASPLFSAIDIDLPYPHDPKAASIALRIRAPGAPYKKYVAGVTVNGRALSRPILKHADLIGGGDIIFRMSTERTDWGSCEGR
jgi:hypothetical protein